MAQADRRKIQAALEAKGFKKRNGDHDFYDLWVEGKKVGIITKISRGSGYKVYGDSLLGAMAKQLCISKHDLLRLIECSLSGDAYTTLLQESGDIEL